MNDPAMGAPRKRMTRMRYDAGPMAFLADQIIKEMQRAGFPAHEHCLYRSPEQQQKEFNDGDSKAVPYSSAHQYFMASDIVHEKWFWFAAKDAPNGDMFFDILWDCVAVVAEKYGVEFKPRLSWDSAHVELANWREFRSIVGHRPPNRAQLVQWFSHTLPRVWRAHLIQQAARKTG